MPVRISEDQSSSEERPSEVAFNALKQVLDSGRYLSTVREHTNCFTCRLSNRSYIGLDYGRRQNLAFSLGGTRLSSVHHLSLLSKAIHRLAQITKVFNIVLRDRARWIKLRQQFSRQLTNICP